MSVQDNHEAAADHVKRRSGHEGPKNHLLTFAVSIALTILAFVAVAYGDELNRGFILTFLVLMAIFQAVMQLFYWMHLKDRGHAMMVVFMIAGGLVAVAAAITAIYWMWW